MVFVGREPCHLPVVEPDDSEIMISEARSGLAILPRLVFASKLAVAGRPHNSEHLFFGIAGVYQHRLLFESATGRKHEGNDDDAYEMEGLHGDKFFRRSVSVGLENESLHARGHVAE